MTAPPPTPFRSGAVSSPQASVLLPFKDAHPWLDDAIASIRGQTFEDFDVIAVDDGSSDGSRARVERWSAEDPRVRVFETAKGDRGIVSALELGRAQARSEFLLRMDADDIAPPGRFGAQVQLLRTRPEIVACGTPVRRFPADTLTGGGRAYEAWLNGLTTPDLLHRARFVECPIAHPTLAIRRDALSAAGGYRSGAFPEDYDLILRLVAAGGALGHAQCAPLLWRARPDSLQRTDPRYSLDAFRALKVKHLLSGPLRDDRPIVIIGSGPTGKAFAKLLIGAGRPIEAFVDLDPRKIGQTMYGAPVIAHGALGPPVGRVALSAVSGGPARSAVKRALEALNWAELTDFWAVA
jgi:glycosyltransferase involved in cell wall biosynthesis